MAPREGIGASQKMDWRGHVGAWKRGGQSAVAQCRPHGARESGFRY